MAVYTHFGGMPELRRAVREEGFTRLDARLARIDEGPDAVTDLARLGLAYFFNGTRNPHIYRVMFLEQPIDTADAGSGDRAFRTLVAGVQRCIAAGRFGPADAVELATQLWAGAHGAVTLHLARFLSEPQALDCFAGTVQNLFTSYGDAPAGARESFARALERAEQEERP